MKNNSTSHQGKSNSSHFNGFGKPQKNYYPTPWNWTDITANINSLAELKVIEYVLKHTWGYREYGICKRITIDEFMLGRKHRDGSRMDNGTGLSDRGVKDGLNLAVEDGYLICEVDESDRARTKKAYRLRTEEDNNSVQNPPPGWEESSPQMGRIFPPDRKNLPPRQEESSYRSERESKDRIFRQDREREEAKEQKDNSPKRDSLSLSLSKSSFSSSLHSEEESLSKEETETQHNSLSSSKEKLREKKSEEPIIDEFTSEEELEEIEADRARSELSKEKTDNLIGYWYMIRHEDLSKNGKARGHFETMVSQGVTTFDQFKKLYDITWQQIEEMARAKGVNPNPPYPGNLVNNIGKLKAHNGRQDQHEKQRHFTQGTGSTKPQEEDRAAKQPVIYASPEEVRKIRSIVVGGGRAARQQDWIRKKNEKQASKIGAEDFGILGSIVRRKSDDPESMQYGDWENE